MKFSLKPSSSALKPVSKSPVSSKLDFSSREEKEPEKRVAHRITSLADAIPQPEALVIPCLYQLNTEKRKENGDILVIDPASEGREAWAARQAEYKEEDLGPPEANAGPLVKVNGRGGALLARAFDVPIGENDTSQYERVPVEDFGAAMIRGMGIDLKDDSQCVAFYEPPKRRAFARSGIGSEKAFLLPHEKQLPTGTRQHPD